MEVANATVASYAATQPFPSKLLLELMDRNCILRTVVNYDFSLVLNIDAHGSPNISQFTTVRSIDSPWGY